LINSAFYEFYQRARNNLLILISETKLAIIVDFMITQIKQLTMLILYCPSKRNNNKYIAYIIYLEH